MSRRLLTLCGMSLIFVAIAFRSALAEGELDTIRSDVHGGAAPAAESPSTDHKSSGNESDGHGEYYDDFESGMFAAGLVVGYYTVLSPFWIPRTLFNDHGEEVKFPRFPYDGTRGYLVSNAWIDSFSADKILNATLKTADSPANDPNGNASAADPPIALSLDPSTRRWGCQVRTDYLDDFDRLSGVGGQFLLETTSRWGVDVSFQQFHEQLSSGDDHLTLGDCNVVYRFAQHSHGQMRTGIGVNWLDNDGRTDLGFNFTYGGDFFPRKPWVLSSEIDWGTLGHAGLFRFRTTAGVVLDRFETYVGYEYLDIGTTQGNFLIGGLRVWF